jgi:hypothetical protein
LHTIPNWARYTWQSLPRLAFALAFEILPASLRRTRNCTLPDVHSLNTANMSDNGEVEVEVPSVNSNILPKEVTAELGSTKLFNKWSYEDVEIRDISLTYD